MGNDGWFTLEQIDQDTYAISEYGHWECVHSYLVVGSQSAALIDTGMGIGNIKLVIDNVTGLPIQVVNTHAHADHIGGNGLFASVAVHPDDAGWLEHGSPLPQARVREWLTKEPLRQPAPAGFNPDTYTPFHGKPTRLLADGDAISLGNRTLTVLHTPGHSPGHVCLYEPDRRFLYTGDLVYKGKLDAFYPSTDPLRFAESVDRLSKLGQINRILPGHYELALTGEFLQRVNHAFHELSLHGLVKHGTGIHAFGDFQVHF